LLDVPGGTLLMLPRLLIEEAFRVQLVEEHVADPYVRAFWLGALLTTTIAQAALSRADMPAAERRVFHLYADEFRSFATDSFALILSEARKYRMTMTVAHQYLEQLPDKLRAAVFDLPPEEWTPGYAVFRSVCFGVM
jgi:hypothetical protein